MKINLDEEDITIIIFSLGYTAGALPIKEEQIKKTMNKITSQLIKQTEKEIKKELKRK